MNLISIRQNTVEAQYEGTLSTSMPRFSFMRIYIYIYIYMINTIHLYECPGSPVGTALDY